MSEPKIIRDIEFTRTAARPLLLDLYLPEGAALPAPLIVWVHGGAFRGGDKRDPPALRMVERGYAVASIQYRLSQEALFPAQIQDCKTAIRWLRAHATAFGWRADCIGAWGASAGGHLVAMLGTTSDSTEFDESGQAYLDISSRVQAVCDFFGPTDFLQMDAAGSTQRHDADDSPESQLVGGPIQERKERVARANPITFVTPSVPPFLIVHGDQDPLVPHHQSALLYAALQRAGVEVTFHTVRGAGHGFRDAEVDRLVNAFFDRHLKQS